MAIDFPNSPTNGDSYSVDSKTWTFDGTSWVLVQGEALIASGAITETKIASNAVTSDKIADGAVTAGKIAANSIDQEKMASNTSGVKITTSTNRSTDIPSPFTGQLIFETDTLRMKVWSGSAWLTITVAPPAAPTSLSAVPSDTSVAISFTAGADNGSAITNHEYAISTNGGVSYGSWVTFSPSDAISPVTISGLSSGTAYHIKLRAVNAAGSGDDSSPVSFTTFSVPNAPTGLSVSSTTSTTATISFTAPSDDGGAAITNYEYSTNNSTWTALSPADAVTPVTISGLSSNTSYTLYLRAVNSVGSGTASSGVSATTSLPAPTSIDFLVIAGGGPGGNGAAGAIEASGGGAGGYRTSAGTSGGGAAAESAVSVSSGSSYTVTVGAGGAGTTGTPSKGSNSVFATITSSGGGYGGGNIPKNPSSGGSGGGGAKNDFGGTGIGGAGTSGQGYAGGNATGQTGGGGGAGAVGGSGSAQVGGSGGAGVSSSITGTAVTRGGGGGGASGYINWGAGGAGGGGSAPSNAGTANTGGGGGGARSTGSPPGGNGGSGFVVLRYPDSMALLTSVSAGLTYTVTTSGGYRIYEFTAGTGTITV